MEFIIPFNLLALTSINQIINLIVMTDKEKNRLNEEYTHIITGISEKKFNEYYVFIRQILIICSTILGVIITLKKDKITVICELYSFICVIVFLGLTILIGVFLLYGKIDALKQQMKAVDKHWFDTIQKGTKSTGSIHVPQREVFSVFEKLYYISFALSICSLVLYGILSFT